MGSCFQGVTAQNYNPHYARDIDVLVPDPSVESDMPDDNTPFLKSQVNYSTAYKDCATRKVIMEERNVFCGPYNVLLLSNE